MGAAHTHSHWVNTAQVWYPEGNMQRWLDAYGENVVKYIEDFVITPKATAAAKAALNPEWIISMVEAGGDDSKVLPADLKGGWMNLSPDKNEDDGVNMQHANESFRVEANSWLYFGIRYKVDEATQSDVLVGLCEQDVSPLTNTSHGIYFKKIDGGTSLVCATVKDKTTAKTLVADALFAADTVYTDEFLAKSTGSVEYWHNGSTIGKYTTPIPSTDLAVTISFLAGAANTSIDMFVDWVRCIQIYNTRLT